MSSFTAKREHHGVYLDVHHHNLHHRDEFHHHDLHQHHDWHHAFFHPGWRHTGSWHGGWGDWSGWDSRYYPGRTTYSSSPPARLAPPKVGQ